MESLESEQYYLLQRMDFYYKKKMYEMNTGMKMGCMVCNGILYPFNCDPKEIMATYKKISCNICSLMFFVEESILVH